MKPRASSKYHAIPTVVDNIRFDSKMEAHRYRQLILLQRAGKIAELELQPPFELVVNGIKICTYVADFRYLDRETWNYVIEDVKGIKTPLYKLKAKLMLACLGLAITEVTR